LLEKVQNNNYFILTGAMGAGKSSILSELENMGIAVNLEPAREIIAEQRSINGKGLYDRDPELFYNLMLSRSIYHHKQFDSEKTPVIFDRGIADNIAYAQLFNIDPTAAINAAKLFSYNQNIFFLNAWEEIYTNDDERKMTFQDAKLFGDSLRIIYQDLGYNLIELPFDSIEKRAQFIYKRL
jgi:predicted ATPase